jgi:hypothetical protein
MADRQIGTDTNQDSEQGERNRGDDEAVFDGAGVGSDRVRRGILHGTFLAIMLGLGASEI